jgi:hypothetical protein
MSFPETAKKILASGVSNLAQVYTDVKYTRAENEHLSRELLEWLERQRFLARAEPPPA